MIQKLSPLFAKNTIYINSDIIIALEFSPKSATIAQLNRKNIDIGCQST